jgi:hypothetical protein
MPVSHSVPDRHDTPSAFLPQDPSWQAVPSVQSASVAQRSPQRVPAHTNGAHARDRPGTQAPRPSQRAASRSIPEAQLSGPHTLPDGYRAHVPSAAQVPSVPQVVGP